MDRVPQFECVERFAGDGSKVWIFWCPYCRREHVHSAGSGHRAAHCYTGSPLRDGGYTLKKAPAERAAAKGHTKRPGDSGVTPKVEPAKPSK